MQMNESPYIIVLSLIKKGETRTFGEIAALACKPSGARAAGRVVSSYPADGSAAWQRAVTADGGLSVDPDRAEIQLERLRKEGARPKDGESIAKWSKRVRAAFVGDWRNRRFAERAHPGVASFDPRFVERFDGEGPAVERGFCHVDDCPVRDVALRSATSSKPRPRRAQSAARTTR